jgi:hypothetical protein
MTLPFILQQEGFDVSVAGPVAEALAPIDKDQSMADEYTNLG